MSLECIKESGAPSGEHVNPLPQLVPLMYYLYIQVTEVSFHFTVKHKRSFNDTYRFCEGICKIPNDSSNHLDEMNILLLRLRLCFLI